MRSFAIAFFALLAGLAPDVSPASVLADIQVYDRSDDRPLPVYRHRGRLYVAGEPKHQYEIRLRNTSGERVLAVTSVDGVNVISGQTAAQQQSGYVLEPYGSVEVDGWRKSLSEVATFYFTSLGDSYAARTGRAQNVGVIGVALFRERVIHHFGSGNDAAKSTAPASPQRERRADATENELGTGHGHRESSSATYVDFERASSQPDETLVIYYDSMRNLIARGIVPRHRSGHGKHDPRPFPNGFVPDP